MREPPLILIVDDNADNCEILEARLASRGYATNTASDGVAALVAVRELQPDLVLLDVMMPGIDGIEVTRRLKDDPQLPFTPIILVTAKTATEDVVQGLDAGADDYLTKPVEVPALLARVRSMLRIKELNDLGQAQKKELAAWNRRLEERVAEQVEEIERVSRLRRFLSPEVAALVLGDEAGLLASRRAEIAVVFVDLRGFTAFADARPAAELIAALDTYHGFAGPLIERHGGTLERFLGDGLMVLFNAPVRCDEPVLRAANLSLALTNGFGRAMGRWAASSAGAAHGLGLGIGIGIAHGVATVGRIGFGERVDYAAIGSVCNLAARLCATAEDGQTLIEECAAAAIRDQRPMAPIGELAMKGFIRKVTVYALSA